MYIVRWPLLSSRLALSKAQLPRPDASRKQMCPSVLVQVIIVVQLVCHRKSSKLQLTSKLAPLYIYWPLPTNVGEQLVRWRSSRGSKQPSTTTWRRSDHRCQEREGTPAYRHLELPNYLFHPRPPLKSTKTPPVCSPQLVSHTGQNRRPDHRRWPQGTE